MRYIATFTVPFGRPFNVDFDARGARSAARLAAERTLPAFARAFANYNGQHWRASAAPADWTLVSLVREDDGPGRVCWGAAARLMRRGVPQDAALRAAARADESMILDWIAARAPGYAVRAWGERRDRARIQPGSRPGVAFCRHGETSNGYPMLSGHAYAWARVWCDAA